MRRLPCRSTTHCRASAFTLVELLAVLAIIMLLIALLMPALRKARRQAIVLASPIAYIGVDKQLYVVPASGGRGVDLGQLELYGGWNRTWVSWSPSGQRIGLHCMDRSVVGQLRPFHASGYATWIVDPMGGQINRFQEREWMGFRTWTDSSHYLTLGGFKIGGICDFRVRDADRGAVEQEYIIPEQIRGSFLYLSRVPQGVMNAFYIGAHSEERGNSLIVRLWTRDLRPGRLIWQQKSDNTAFPTPQVDPTGEWCAWTVYDWKTGGRGVAVKKLNADAAVLPTLIKLVNAEYCIFCDWTEQGTMLVNMTEGAYTGSHDASAWALKIIDTQGRIVRDVPTDVRPYPESIASWRKYGHH
jgi:hypothetical protein